MSDDPHGVADILDRLGEIGERKDEVAVGDTVEAFGHRSYGPFLFLPAVIDISPIGGIPGLPTVLAAIIILFAAQMLFGRKHLWLPGILSRRRVSSEKIGKTVETMRPWGKRLDRWFHGRLPALTKGPFVRVAALACILLALTVPPLEIVPFATTAPMAAIAMFGLALLVRDGALMIAATVLACVAVYVGWRLLPF